MHASIRRYIVRAGREEEAIQHAQDGFLPILKSIPGFIAYYFIDTGDGEMIGVSIYQDIESAERANESARAYIGEHIPETLSRTAIFDGRVAVHWP